MRQYTCGKGTSIHHPLLCASLQLISFLCPRLATVALTRAISQMAPCQAKKLRSFSRNAVPEDCSETKGL